MNAAALRRAVLVALVGLSACGGGEPGGSPSAWVDYADVALDMNGQSDELSVPLSAEPVSQAGLLIEVASAPFQCVQVDSLRDAAGHVYVGPPESGPYCLACEQRSSVAGGGGLFAFPSRGGPFQPVGTLQLRLGLRDCDTLTRGVTPAAAQRLSVRVRRAGAPVARGSVSLRLLIAPASAFHDPATDAALDALLAALNAELASAQITARWAGVTRLPADAASDAAFSRADPGALRALLQQLPAAPLGCRHRPGRHPSGAGRLPAPGRAGAGSKRRAAGLHAARSGRRWPGRRHLHPGQPVRHTRTSARSLVADGAGQGHGP
jgi:hypothetical protein